MKPFSILFQIIFNLAFLMTKIIYQFIITIIDEIIKVDSSFFWAINEKTRYNKAIGLINYIKLVKSIYIV
jgi:hypothetical protein